MEGLLNFHSFSSDIGTSGQPTREQFAQIAAQGYTAVVNLAMHNSDNALTDEGGIVASLGMLYVHIPVPFGSPSATHLKTFVRIMDALADHKVLVHCAVNARVSAFMYKYLTLTKNVDDASATSPILKRWLPQMDTAWSSIIALTHADIST